MFSSKTTSPGIPILISPSFFTLIFTAYTKFTLSFLVCIILGVNSDSLEIHVMLPLYVFNYLSFLSIRTVQLPPSFKLDNWSSVTYTFKIIFDTSAILKIGRPVLINSY